MRSRTRFLAALAAIVAVATGFTVAPAAAGHKPHAASLCSALPLAGQNTFGLTTVAQGGSASRGEPGAMGSQAAFVAAPKGAKSTGVVTVPVHFHVLAPGSRTSRGTSRSRRSSDRWTC